MFFFKNMLSYSTSFITQRRERFKLLTNVSFVKAFFAEFIGPSEHKKGAKTGPVWVNYRFNEYRLYSDTMMWRSLSFVYDDITLVSKIRHHANKIMKPYEEIFYIKKNVLIYTHVVMTSISNKTIFFSCFIEPHYMRKISVILKW